MLKRICLGLGILALLAVIGCCHRRACCGRPSIIGSSPIGRGAACPNCNNNIGPGLTPQPSAVAPPAPIGNAPPQAAITPAQPQFSAPSQPQPAYPPSGSQTKFLPYRTSSIVVPSH